MHMVMCVRVCIRQRNKDRGKNVQTVFQTETSPEDNTKISM